MLKKKRLRSTEKAGGKKGTRGKEESRCPEKPRKNVTSSHKNLSRLISGSNAGKGE